eukprot:gnl/Hemi2/23696_TR7954_c0_g2_i1.p1 gnl/Hemi2/23696_TR7954_c0_g2~~gnl/Hemi2/23696_TR7954_c0_g2_i1.p1  ORF type:complete len:716 (+),score=197.92 gnl/Hemi2/23696_TR7954_c0_g2_i1:62-2209(+)
MSGRRERRARDEAPPPPPPPPQLINPEEFLRPDFSADVFVGKLTRDILDQPITDSTFEQLNSVFDQTLRGLTDFGSRLDSQIGALAQGTAAAERKHKNKLGELDSMLEEIFQSFQQLDKRITVVSNTAVRIGEQLGTMETQRLRAVDAMELIKYLCEFNTGDRRKVSSLFFDTHRAHEAAIVMYKLSSFSKELHVSGKYATACKLMDEVGNEVNNLIFLEFDEANRLSDIGRVKKCAQTLNECNKEELLYRRYISSLGLFADPMQYQKVLEKVGNNPFEGLRIVCQTVMVDVLHEHERIIQIFTRHPAQVMRILMQRLFEDRIHSFIEDLLETAGRQSSLLYLRVLDAAYTQVLGLVNQLRTLSHVSADGIDFLTMMHAVFGLYREEYIGMEVRSLQEVCSREIDALACLGQNPSVQAVEDGVQRMVAAQEEAMLRCANLSFEKDLAPHYHRILSTLFVSMDSVLTNLVTTALQTLGKTPDGSGGFFEGIRVSNISVLKLRAHVHNTFMCQTSLLPHLQAASLAEMRAIMLNVERKITGGLETAIDGIVNQVKKALTKQLVADFNPKEDGSMLDNNLTTACAEAVQVISRQCRMVASCLDGKNLEMFLTELATRLQGVLLDHMRKFVVSTVGGLRLMRDLTEYQNRIRDFNIPAADERFALLRELGNVYLVAPENLRNLMQESGLAKMRASEVHAYIAQRADYKTANIAQFIQDM